jgi:hypothetical protein
MNESGDTAVSTSHITMPDIENRHVFILPKFSSLAQSSNPHSQKIYGGTIDGLPAEVSLLVQGRKHVCRIFGSRTAKVKKRSAFWERTLCSLLKINRYLA